jgi:hypothetical protein
LAGFIQAGAPVIIRGSRTIAANETGVAASISSPTAVSGRLAFHTRNNVAIVNIQYRDMLTMSTLER